jgi:hypothetical protein
MDVSIDVRERREAWFLEGVDNFLRRDFEAMERTMDPHIVMQLPGGSWLAGTYRGPEEVGRCILGLRQVLATSRSDVSYLHERDRMVVTHKVAVQGPRHEIEMTFIVAISFGPDDRVTAVSVEPTDLGLFDHVVNTAARD